jgi:hypothetical protein
MTGSAITTLRSKPMEFWARLFLGGVLIAASPDKILHPAAFAEIVHNYQILPDWLINVTAIVLPWLELGLGILLIAGWVLPGSVLLANLLLLSFFTMLIYNAARSLDVQCGCFTTQTTGAPTATIWYLLRDAAFLLVAGYLFWKTLIVTKRDSLQGKPQPPN